MLILVDLILADLILLMLILVGLILLILILEKESILLTLILLVLILVDLILVDLVLLDLILLMLILGKGSILGECSLRRRGWKMLQFGPDAPGGACRIGGSASAPCLTQCAAESPTLPAASLQPKTTRILILILISGEDQDR